MKRLIIRTISAIERPYKFQRTANAIWPVALLVMVITVPFLVKKSYDEKKGDR